MNMFENFVNGLGLREGLVLGSVAGSTLVLVWVHSHQNCFSTKATCPTIFFCPAKFFKKAEQLEEKAADNLAEVFDNAKENIGELASKANECLEDAVEKTKDVVTTETIDDCSEKAKKNEDTKADKISDKGSKANSLIEEDFFKNEELEGLSLAGFNDSTDDLETSYKEKFKIEVDETNELFDVAKEIKEDKKCNIKKTKKITNAKIVKEIPIDANEIINEMLFKDAKRDDSSQATSPKSVEVMEAKRFVETADNKRKEFEKSYDEKEIDTLDDNSMTGFKETKNIKVTQKRKIKNCGTGKTKKDNKPKKATMSKVTSKQPVWK